MKNKENQGKLRKIESAGKENAGKGLASMRGPVLRRSSGNGARG